MVRMRTRDYRTRRGRAADVREHRDCQMVSVMSSPEPVTLGASQECDHGHDAPDETPPTSAEIV